MEQKKICYIYVRWDSKGVPNEKILFKLKHKAWEHSVPIET
jgi:hypothetical protein